MLLIFDFIQRTIKPRQHAFDYFQEIENPALLLAFALQEIKQIEEIKRRRTLSRIGVGCPSGAIDLSDAPIAKDPGMRSNGFDFIQTDSRQNAWFLIFNQSFLFKGDSENERGPTARSNSRNSPNEPKDAKNARRYRGIATHDMRKSVRPVFETAQ